MQICENIKQARLSSGASQEDIAHKLGINRDTYKNWELKTEPDFTTINKIGKAIGVPPVSLLSGVIDFTAQEIAEATNQVNRKKENDVVANLAKLTSAIGRLVGLHEEQILNSVQSFALGKTGAVVSQQLADNKTGKKKRKGN